MTVIRPNSISGITSITAQSDTINIYKSDGTLSGLQLNGVNFNTTSGISTFSNIVVSASTSSFPRTFETSFVPTLQLQGDSASTSSSANIRWSNNTGGANYTLGKSRGSFVGSSSTVQGSDTLGSLAFYGDVGSSYFLAAASIRAFVGVGTVNSTSLPGFLQFNTTSDGTSSPQERLRITENGNVGIGTINPQEKVVIYGAVAIGASNTIDLSSPTGARVPLRMVNDNGSLWTGGGMINETYGPFAPGYVGRYARGTAAVPSQVLSGDRLAFLVGSGFGTSVFRNPGAVNIYAQEDFTDSSAGSYINFETCNIGSNARTEKVRITANGEVLVGSSVTTGSVRVFSTFGDRYYYIRGDSTADYGAIGARTSSNTVNTDVLVWTPSGRVGVGLTNPATATKFHIRDDTTTRGRMIVQQSDQRTIVGAHWQFGVTQYGYIQGKNDAESVNTALVLNPDGGAIGINTIPSAATTDIFESSATGCALRVVGERNPNPSGLAPALVSSLRTHTASNSAYRSQFAACGIGTTSGEQAVYTFWPTFANYPLDMMPRRAADIVGGFSTSTWGTEYLAFHVGNNGGSNDAAVLTSEKLRIDASGRILVGITTASGSSLLQVASGINDSIGNVRDIPQNARTSSYTLVSSDAGKHIDITTGGVTVPAGVFSVGNVITIFNDSTSNQTITQGASVTLRQAGTSSTGNRTLAQYGVATLLCVGTNTFVISGAGLS